LLLLQRLQPREQIRQVDSSARVKPLSRPSGIIDFSRVPRSAMSAFSFITVCPATLRTSTLSPPSRVTKPSMTSPFFVLKKAGSKPCASFASGVSYVSR